MILSYFIDFPGLFTPKYIFFIRIDHIRLVEIHFHESFSTK